MSQKVYSRFYWPGYLKKHYQNYALKKKFKRMCGEKGLTLKILYRKKITMFPRQSLKRFNFCVKSGNSIFLGLSPIVI